jgi:hypothetical protein
MLMKMSIQQLYVVAPHLFNEDITSANTEITKENVVEELKEKAKEVLESFDSGNFHSFY